MNGAGKLPTPKPDRLAYRAACRTANELIMKSRAASNLERINSCSKNPKSLWTTIKSILHSSTPAEQLPPAVFQNHWLTLWFLSSVRRLSLLNLPYPPNLVALHLPLLLTNPIPDRKLNDFTPVTPAEVTKLLNSMSSKSSPLDYVSTSLLKSCAGTFSILISHLANLSFDQGAFPSKFKHALITPLLKKPGLSKSDPSNFRPISNLNTIGKILERLALARLLPHLSNSPSFFTPSVGISKVPLYRNSFAQNWPVISWTPLILERLQFSLLSICRLLLTRWTTPPSFTGLNIHSVCQEMSTPGFIHT